jgi:tRNA A37 threonylcarbamoyladenosine dehydratase
MVFFERAELLIGKEKINSLINKRVAVFGVGGVGGFTVEALARSGVGEIHIFDGDTIDESNINRQIIALNSSVGQDKVKVFEERLKQINPDIKVKAKKIFFMPENSNEIAFENYDYVVDAVDTVTAKIEIIRKAKEKSVPVITCMGTGGKLDPLSLRIADISKTSVCPLARVMRKELKDRGITGVLALYSLEEPIKPTTSCFENGKKQKQPSMIFVPASAGLLIAKQVVMDLISK